jgi:hypothetical protein
VSKNIHLGQKDCQIIGLKFLTFSNELLKLVLGELYKNDRVLLGTFHLASKRIKETAVALFIHHFQFLSGLTDEGVVGQVLRFGFISI